MYCRVEETILWTLILLCSGMYVLTFKRQLGWWRKMRVCSGENSCAHLFFDVKVYSICYVQTCKVQNSPVSNKTELRPRNGIPPHSRDSASPGAWINVYLYTHSHKQSLPNRTDRPHSNSLDEKDTQSLITQDCSSRYAGVLFQLLWWNLSDSKGRCVIS